MDDPIVNRKCEIIRDTDKEFEGMTDDESIDYQVHQWLEGRPLHNPIRGECCPDFSCCNGGKILPREVRERFVEAYTSGDNKTQYEILGMGLSGLAASMGKDIHIAGESGTIH